MHPGRCQLDRERHAVEAAARLDDRLGVIRVDGESGPYRASPLGEQADSSITLELAGQRQPVALR